jgi:MFS family permease
MIALAVDDVGPLDSTAVDIVVGVVGVLLVLTLGRELPRVPKQLLALMASAFVDMIGLFLILPLLPFYVRDMAGDGLGLPVFGTVGVGALTGLVVSSYTGAQLLCAPLWGRLSDRVGRRPVLLVSLFASAAGFVILGLADSLWLLLLSRVVQGAGGGTVGVVQAYVADSVEPAQRTRALGWLSAATNLGVALGPYLGAQLVKLGKVDLLPGDATLQLGATAPGLGAAALCLLNAIFVWRYVRESRQRPATPRVDRPISTLRAAARVVTRMREPSSRLILVYGIAIGSFQVISAVLALFLDERFRIDEETIGYVFMYIGAISVFARVLLLGRLVDRLGEARLSRFGIVTLSAGLLGIAAAGSLPTLALAVALLPLGAAFTFPAVTSMLSHTVADADRGLYMGLQQSFGGTSRLIAPLVYGWAFDALGSSVPFEFASLLVLSTLALALGLGNTRSAPPR